MKRRLLIYVLVGLLGPVGLAHAVPVGVLSFDNLIPGPGGVNAFNVTNLTGDPGAGGFALPPDFPVMTSLSFLAASLSLTLADSSVQTVPLGDIGPGPFSIPALEFPDTTEFLSAILSAVLSQTSLLLDNGSTVDVLPALTATLVPTVGSVLVAGLDLVILEATPATVPIPEPRTWVLLASGVLPIWAWHWGRAHTRRRRTMG